MINIENQHKGSSSPMNAEFETVLTGLRELKDRNLPEVMRGEIGRQVAKTTTTTTTVSAPTPTGPRMSGIVKWFNPTKGFGFITPSNGGLDVFVHQSEIQLPGFRSLAQGEPVEYQLYDGQKGPKALKVTGPQGKQVKGAPRQTKAKPEKSAMADPTKVQPNLIKLASNHLFQVANQIPVSTPVLAPTQALNALPSMISTPTPASPQISHFIVTQPGLQNYYTTTSDFSSFTTASELPTMTSMPMSPTPMMIETSMPMSPVPQQYIPFTPVSSFPSTPTPFAFPNQTQCKQNSMQMNVVNSPPAQMDYSYQMPFMQQENPYDPNPSSFIDESSHMQITSPMSPIHC